jgi:hypothetical protein
MKKIIVLHRAWSVLIAICGFCVFAAVSRGQGGAGGGYPGDRKDAYVNDGSGEGNIYVGTVFWNYGTGRVQGVLFDNYDDANGWLDGYSGQGYDVYYDQSSRNSCFDQAEGCYDEEFVLNPIVAQTMRTLSAALPPQSVAVSDTAYVFSFGNEGTQVGTAVYAKVGGDGMVMRYVSHFFTTTAEAEAYLQLRASQHAIIVYPANFVQIP